MGRGALAAALEERLGMEASDRGVAQAETVGDLRALLRRPAANVRLSDSNARIAAPPDFAAHTGEAPALPQASAAPLSALPYRYPRWPASAPVRLLRQVFLEVLLRPLVRIFGSPRVSRTSLPLQGPMLLSANHRTAIDIALLLYALPRPLRGRVAVAMSGEILAGWQQSWNRRPLPPALREHRRWWGPFAAVLVQALFRVFPLPRTSGFRQSFTHAGRALDHGDSVLIFPEGGRAPQGSMLPFKPGLGILVLEGDVPVLPMALRIPENRRERPAIIVGSPMTADPGLTAAEVTAQLEAAVKALLHR